jgi:hypothetical protein
MQLHTVTFTGADDSILPMRLVDLTVKYPFVEWGILMSAAREGSTRYPSLPWLEALAEVADTFLLPLSGHVCGRWCRGILKGSPSFFDERPSITKMFRRIQLNYHDSANIDADCDAFLELLRSQQAKQEREYIFPCKGFDKPMPCFWEAVPKVLGITRSSVLFDASGGLGILPEQWPQPFDNTYCGYAGGLSPDNIEEQLKILADIVGDRSIWIDFETHVRSGDDSLFDLDKVEKCLAITKAYA